MFTNCGINDNAYINTTKNSCVQSNFLAKLRRLKLEESILRESLNKKVLSTQNDFEMNLTNCNKISSDQIKFTVEIKKNYNVLKQLFQDIKASTSSKHVIKLVDIDDIKKNTNDFEKTLKLFKLRLHTELSELKIAEKELNKWFDDAISNFKLERKLSRRIAKYTEMVESPVKLVMTSPYKCSAVQDFQDFITNSKNRYGGWDEYYHNIFVDLWQKHLETQYPLYSDDIVSTTVKSTEFNLFLSRLMPKLLGASEKEVITHAKWYIKYLHLKFRQQEAIDKWRSNRLMRSSANVLNNNNETASKNNIIKIKKCKTDKKIEDSKKQNVKLEDSDGTRCFARNCLSDENYGENNCIQVNTDHDDQKVLHFLKPTKQWMIRCSIANFTMSTNVKDVDNIKKLGIPSWRNDL